MTAALLYLPSTLALLASFFAIRKARTLARTGEERTRARCEELQATAEGLQKALDSHAAQLAEIEQHQSAAPVPNLPRAGMNVTKRSHVLRLHRKGDAPERIAATLELPLQEVDLLIKVHRIVLGNL